MKRFSILFAGALTLLANTGLAAGNYSNTRVSNAHKPGLLQPPAKEVFSLPPSIIRGWTADSGQKTDWMGGRTYTNLYVIVRSLDGDYFYARPANDPEFRPSEVYSKAHGKFVPYPVQYENAASAIRIEPAFSNIEPVPDAASPVTVIPGPTN